MTEKRWTQFTSFTASLSLRRRIPGSSFQPFIDAIMIVGSRCGVPVHNSWKSLFRKYFGCRKRSRSLQTRASGKDKTAQQRETHEQHLGIDDSNRFEHLDCRIEESSWVLLCTVLIKHTELDVEIMPSELGFDEKNVQKWSFLARLHDDFNHTFCEVCDIESAKARCSECSGYVRDGQTRFSGVAETQEQLDALPWWETTLHRITEEVGGVNVIIRLWHATSGFITLKSMLGRCCEGRASSKRESDG